MRTFGFHDRIQLPADRSSDPGRGASALPDPEVPGVGAASRVCLLLLLGLGFCSVPLPRAAAQGDGASSLTPITGEYPCDGDRIRLAMDPSRALVRLDPAVTGGARATTLDILGALADRSVFAPPTGDDLLGYPDTAQLRFLEGISNAERLTAIRALDAAAPTLWASGAFSDPDQIPDGSYHIPLPQVIVILDEGSAHETLRAILDSSRLPGDPTFTVDRALHAAHPTFVLDTGAFAIDSFAIAFALAEMPGVRAAQPEFIRKLNSHGTPNDTLFLTQWDLDNTGQHGGTPGADLRAIEAWDITTGSNDITVAIIDEGIDTTHPDLVPQLVPGYDAVTIPTGGGPAVGALPGHADPDDAHGTACAGIVGARGDNALGTTGICWEVTLLPIRIGFGDFWTQDSWLADGIAAALGLGADVLSNSWGGGSPSPAVNAAIVNAVTNGRGGLGTSVFFSSGNADIPMVAYPASHPDTIAVGASSPCDERKSITSCDGQWWWGSQYGPELDIVAPGPLVTTTDNVGPAGYVGGNFVEFSGTSSACPHAAGAAALLLSVDPILTATQVRDLITSTAQDEVGPPGEDTTGWDPYMGFGRLDLMEMLIAAGGATIPPSNVVCSPDGLDAVLEWTNGEVYSSIVLTRNGLVIAALPGDATTYTDVSPGLGLHRYKISGLGPNGPSPRSPCSALVIGIPTDLVWSPRSGPIPGGAPIAETLLSLGRLPLLVADLADAGSLDQYESIWVNLGVFSGGAEPGKHVLTTAEGQLLDDFLAGGTASEPRYLYMEGGDTWFFDPPTPVHSRFGISGLDDGTPQGQLATVNGVGPNGTPCAFNGLSFTYIGENNFIDWLLPVGGGTLVLSNASPSFGVAVANEAVGYRTLGASWEMAGIADGVDSLHDFVETILDCWGIPYLLDPLPDPIENLACTVVNATTQLAWGLGDGYDQIEVHRNGSLIAVLPGTATTTIDPVPNSGPNVYEVVGLSGGLGSLSVACSATHAVPDNVLRIPDVVAQVGETIDIPVLADHPIPLEGYAFSILYDPSVLTVTQVTMAGTELEAAGAEFFGPAFDNATGVITASAMVDPTPPVTDAIPAGNDHVVLRILGQVSSAASIGSSTVLELPESLGSPAIVTLFLENGMIGHPPQRIDGSLTIAENPDLRLRGSAEFATPGGSATTTIFLDTDRPLSGYGFGVPFDDAALFPLGASLVGTVGEAAVFSMVVIDPPAQAVTATVITDLIAPIDDVIPVGDGQPALFIEWIVDAALPDQTTIDIPIASGLGNPPVPLALTDDGNVPLIPVTLPGTIFVEGLAPAGPLFIRGDVGMDGTVTLADPIALLSYLFQSVPVSCEDSGDANDDGILDIADVIYTLQHLFANGPAPLAPFPTAGTDPTDDLLGCD